MTLALSSDELLTTTRSVRKRLDFTRPVERDLVETCARLAFQAPNGSNQQGWAWVFVDDPATRAAMADLYRQGLQDHLARDRTGEREPDRSAPTQQRISTSVAYLIERMQSTLAARTRSVSSLWRDCHAAWHDASTD